MFQVSNFNSLATSIQTAIHRIDQGEALVSVMDALRGDLSLYQQDQFLDGVLRELDVLRAGRLGRVDTAAERIRVRGILGVASEEMASLRQHTHAALSLFMDIRPLQTILEELGLPPEPLESSIPPAPRAPDVEQFVHKRLSQPIDVKLFRIEELLRLIPTQAVHFKLGDMGVKILHANPEVCRVAGMTEEEMQAADFLELIHPEDIPGAVGLVKTTVEKRFGSVEGVRLLAKRGDEYVYIPSDIRAIMPQQGNEGIAIIIDQTLRYQAMRQYERSRAELVRHKEQFLQGPPACNITLDEKRHVGVTDVSHSLAELLGYSREELLRKPKITDLIAQRSLPEFAAMLQLVQGLSEKIDTESGRQLKRFIWMRRQDGTEIPIDFVASLGSLDGKVFVRGDFSDARPRLEQENMQRDRQRMERERESMRAKEEAALTMSDIFLNGLMAANEPLLSAVYLQERIMKAMDGKSDQAVEAALDAIIDDLTKASEQDGLDIATLQGATTPQEKLHLLQAEAVRQARRTESHLLKLGLSLREHIKAQSGQRLIVTFRLSSLLDQARLEQQLASRGVKLGLALEAEEHRVSADRSLLERVIQILVDNAVEAMEEAQPRLLKIAISNETFDDAGIFELKKNIKIVNEHRLKPGSYVRLMIQDSGEGIEGARLTSIFDSGQTNRDEGHAGQGLFTARSLVDESLGVIGVTSALGKGSTFFVWLPRSEYTRDSSAGMLIG